MAAAAVCMEGCERGSRMEGSELKRKAFHCVLWALVRVGVSNVVNFVVFTVWCGSITAEFQCWALVILVVDVVRIGPGGMQW